MIVPPQTKKTLASWLKNYLNRKARKSARSIDAICGSMAIYAKTDSFLYVLDEEKKEHKIGLVILPRTKEEQEEIERKRASITTGRRASMRFDLSSGKATINQPATIGESNG